jgi:hypothetical protein
MFGGNFGFWEPAKFYSTGLTVVRGSVSPSKDLADFYKNHGGCSVKLFLSLRVFFEEMLTASQSSIVA